MGAPLPFGQPAACLATPTAGMFGNSGRSVRSACGMFGNAHCRSAGRRTGLPAAYSLLVRWVPQQPWDHRRGSPGL